MIAKQRSREKRARGRGAAGAALLAAAAVGVVALLALEPRRDGSSPPTAPVSLAERRPLPLDVDPSVPLAAVAERLDACAAKRSEEASCSGVVYFWTSEMPLSLEGIAEITSAARKLGIAVDVVRSAELYPPDGESHGRVAALAAQLVAAGASLHAPSIIVHRAGTLDRSAILGYKSADAYAALIDARLGRDLTDAAGHLPGSVAAAPAGASSAASGPRGGGSASGDVTSVGGNADAAVRSVPAASAGDSSWKDFAAEGTPGAYFRWVPGRNSVAYEAAGRIYLLDLETGENGSAPGFVDFVPTPDGRLFVTPGRGALEFYDADEVFEASRAGRGRGVQPIYSDPEMRDQYPSVGILSSTTEAGVTRTVYRVLTSWFSEVAFRDYEVRTGQGSPVVTPAGEPTVACRAGGFSIPILAPSGREVAGRDEASATTKVFRLADDGGCEEAADLQLPTGKVAWHADNRRLAFAIPQGAVSDGSGVVFRGGGGQDRAGIFLYDRRDGSVTRIEGSVDARRLAFPEFVGGDQVMFVLPPERSGGPGRFRLVCCLR